MFMESGGKLGCRKVRCQLQLGTLFLGAVTQLLLGALGTTVMARVIGNRSVFKSSLFLANKDHSCGCK